MPASHRAHLFLAAAVLAGSSCAQETLPDAAALLDRCEREARGQVEHIRSMVSRGKSELTLRIGDRPPQTLPGTYEEYHEGDRFYSIADYGESGRHEEGCDGKVVWEIDPNSGALVKTGDERALTLRLNQLVLGSWRSFYDAAKTVGARDIDGVPCWSIVMQPKEGEGDAETWYLGRDDVRLHGMDLRMRTGGPTKSDAVIRMSDYERVEGVDWPRTYVLRFGVVTITIHQDQIERDVDIPAERFALPEAIQRLAAAGASAGGGEGGLPPRASPTDGAAAPATGRSTGKYEITVTSVQERPAVVIRVKVAEKDIGTTLSVAFPEVMDYLNQEKVMPTGPPFTRYHSFTPGRFDLEAGMPVPKAMAGSGRIRAVTLPGGTVVTTFHVGPYQELGNAYHALQEWMKAEGRTPAGPPWEVYMSDPGADQDPKKQTTRIFWPIDDKQ